MVDLAHHVPAPRRRIRRCDPILALALLCVALICPSMAAAAEAPADASPMIRIAVSDHGRSLFNIVVEAIKATAPPGMQHVTTSGSPMTVTREFCQNVNGTGPDIVLTTRRLPSSVLADCENNGVGAPAAVELGRAALVLATRPGGKLTGLTARQVYLALARDVPDRGEFHRNTSVRWSDIDRSLPQQDIRFQLPPQEYGGRALFDSLVLEGGCRGDKFVRSIFDAGQRVARCISTRIDRVREIPRDNAVRALIDAPVGTIGVLSQTDIADSDGKLVALMLDGVTPTPETIFNGSYEFTTSFWLYAKRTQDNPTRPPGTGHEVQRIVQLVQNDQLTGPNGALARLGMIPLPEEDRAAQRAELAEDSGGYGLTGALDWVSDSITGTISGTWNLIGSAFTDVWAPPANSSIEFTDLMELAGYKLKELSSSIGLIPSASMTFGIAREMSDSDREYIERALSRDARQRTGLKSRIQRSIIHTVIDASDNETFQVNKVEINFLPLPYVQLTITPKGGDGEASAEAAIMSRLLERLQPEGGR